LTKAERKHYSDLVQLGCIACIVKSFGYSIPEIHHARVGVGMGQKNHYTKAIGLCPPHHRTGGHGVAIHAGQETWEANFGTETELLEKTNQLLRG
jgi:hypothetical protein